MTPQPYIEIPTPPPSRSIVQNTPVEQDCPKVRSHHPAPADSVGSIHRFNAAWPIVALTPVD
ncbi:hypothetical protein PN441_07730 [Spirulina major CS-329]|uniref:hypothetical protein n=1 Tax=Spirulina TaxID=1154 RepID=UPI0023310475|nr:MULTISPECIES: hypothetical protein [Spirulina]MDB9495177.1 hypothetical protein [Spirulina subsalsa CS-330]MDB9502959.1 hypothetical protein [Spirulina major CS-329]